MCCQENIPHSYMMWVHLQLQILNWDNSEFSNKFEKYKFYLEKDNPVDGGLKKLYKSKRSF